MKKAAVLKTKNGFTFIELIVAMAIFSVLGAAVVGLVQTGLSSYTSIRTDMSEQTEARTAMSLVTVQLRQHDETGAISVPSDTQLVLKDDPEDSNSPGLKIWFDSASGMLCSQYFNDVIDETSGGEVTQVAAVADFEIGVNVDLDSNLIYTITIEYGNKGRELSQQIMQRSVASAST